MTPPIDSFIEAPAKTRIHVGLAPAQNAIHSLLLLTKVEELSGLGDWVVNTVEQLTVEELQLHNRVMIGFHFAIIPTQRWPSFPIYLEHLAEMEPEALRDKLLHTYLKMPLIDGETKQFTEETAIASEESYIDFLKSRFAEKHIDKELERWAYHYVIDPLGMQELIVTHLQKYWDEYLEDEWERVLPILTKAVNAFQQTDLERMDNFEATEYITGQTPDSAMWKRKIRTADSLYFAPSLHVGPYLGKFFEEEALGIFFGARLPENAPIYAPELSQADIYVRLNALADETRLLILKHLSNEGESCSSEISEALDLSQSAASRHLTQLTATGYLTARRRDGAKCYQLDRDRISSSLDTVKVYLTS